MRMTVHGGDVEAIARKHGVERSSLIDFSANIAPEGPPANVAQVLRDAAESPRTLAPYPSPTYRALREQIGAMLDVDPACVVVGHGGPALLDLALRVSRAASWLVPVPAFSEYRRALDAAQLPLHVFALPPSMELNDDVFATQLERIDGAGALLNTPHNPSGRALERDRTLALLERCEAIGRPMIVDEAFIDYVPERSIVARAVRSPRAIVLRSLTKFYALAGVRVAYALAHSDLAQMMRASGPSWPVGTLDAAIAFAALRDDAYAVRTREQNEHARGELATTLAQVGLSIVPSAANFLFAELPVRIDRFDDMLGRLLERGIIVRDCRTYEGLEQRSVIRVAVLDRERNARLIAALSDVLSY
jgi:threonine-phosphate decarboxylase